MNKPRITNLPLTVADKQETHTIDSATRRWGMKVREDDYTVRWAADDGKVGGASPAGPYLTMDSKSPYDDSLSPAELLRDLNSPLPLFFAADTVPCVVEIVEYF